MPNETLTRAGEATPDCQDGVVRAVIINAKMPHEPLPYFRQTEHRGVEWYCAKLLRSPWSLW